MNACRVEAIWVKPRRGQPMRPMPAVELIANRGILGNANQNGRRQVTVITRESWERVQRQLGPVDPALRRANFMISGIELENSRGMLLRLGNTLIEIWGETRPCRLMDDARDGLQDALREKWGGGAFGVVLQGGTVRVGDAAELLNAPAGTPYRNWKEKRLLDSPAGKTQLVFDLESDQVPERH